MHDRERALAEIAEIARRHRLSPDEIASALGGTAPENVEPRAPADDAAAAMAARRPELLVRVLGILGGTFVFAGIGVFIALQWDAMNSGARVVVTLGSGVAAFALALAACREARFEKAATPFFLVAAALEPTGMFVAFDEFGTGGDWRLAAIIVSGTVGVQFAAAFAALGRSTLLFLAIFFGASLAWSGFDYLDVDGTLTALTIGASLLAAAVGADRAGRGGITPLWYLIGGIAFLGGVFDAVEGSVLEILFLAVAAGFVYLSAAVRSRTLLVVSTLAILAYTGWFTGRHFADSVGWPVALIAFGFLMIGLSAVAFRIDRDYVRRRPVPPGGGT
jgi:hypothetical protein